MGSISYYTISNREFATVLSGHHPHIHLLWPVSTLSSFLWFSALRRASPTPWPSTVPHSRIRACWACQTGPLPRPPRSLPGPRYGHIGCSSHSNQLNSNALHIATQILLSLLCVILSRFSTNILNKERLCVVGTRQNQEMSLWGGQRENPNPTRGPRATEAQEMALCSSSRGWREVNTQTQFGLSVATRPGSANETRVSDDSEHCYFPLLFACFTEH